MSAKNYVAVFMQKDIHFYIYFQNSLNCVFMTSITYYVYNHFVLHGFRSIASILNGPIQTHQTYESISKFNVFPDRIQELAHNDRDRLTCIWCKSGISTNK